MSWWLLYQVLLSTVDKVLGDDLTYSPEFAKWGLSYTDSFMNLEACNFYIYFSAVSRGLGRKSPQYIHVPSLGVLSPSN